MATLIRRRHDAAAAILIARAAAERRHDYATPCLIARQRVMLIHAAAFRCAASYADALMALPRRC